jgi:hypothetical protein
VLLCSQQENSLTALFVDNFRRSGETLLAGQAFKVKAQAIYIDSFIYNDAERLKNFRWTHKRSTPLTE